MKDKVKETFNQLASVYERLFSYRLLLCVKIPKAGFLP